MDVYRHSNLYHFCLLCLKDNLKETSKASDLQKEVPAMVDGDIMVRIYNIIPTAII